MGAFAIACPQCGKYAQAKTGFFARKKIDCSCGNVINVRTDKLASRKCPHCKNQVVFDQSKGEDALCPICHGKINTVEILKNADQFTCAQCGIELVASESASYYVCPVCDYQNDVQQRLMAAKIKKDGLASVIKYEGDNRTFVWKHPLEDFNYGSQLIVHETQEAIFFKDGQALDTFGPGRYTLETQQLPLLEKMYVLPADAQKTFHSEVYFINKTVQMAIKWGTPEKVRFIDPLTGTPLEIGASGEMNLQVSNSRKLLLKLVGTMNGIAWDDGKGFTKSLQDSFRPLISSAVKTNLSNVIKDEQIDLLEIDSKLDIISANLREKIKAGFEEFGLTIPQFYVTNVLLPENDPNFKRIKELHTITLQTRMFQADAIVKTAQAQSEAQYKTAQAQGEAQYRTAQEQSKAAIEAAHREAEMQRQFTDTEVAKKEAERRVIAAEAEAAEMRMKGLTEAEIMRAKGYSQRDVLQADVQKAYAEGIGNMGPAISAGGGGGNSIISDMMGLSVGMAAASAIAPQVGNMFQGMSMNQGQNANAAQGGATPVQNGNTAQGGMTQWQGNFDQNSAAGQNMGMQNGAMPWQNGNAAQGGATPWQNANTAQSGATPWQNFPQENDNTWDCACGNKGVIGNFCNNCGSRRPVPSSSDTWDCNCGMKGIIGNFCNNCGAKRPEEKNGWDCACGNKGVIGNFCNICGAKKPDDENAGWDCSCGNKGITGNFCTNCGKKRGEE